MHLDLYGMVNERLLNQIIHISNTILVKSFSKLYFVWVAQALGTIKWQHY